MNGSKVHAFAKRASMRNPQSDTRQILKSFLVLLNIKALWMRIIEQKQFFKCEMYG